MISGNFHVLIPMISLAMNALSHVIIFRYFKKPGMFKSIVLGFFVGLLTTTYLEVAIFSDFNSGLLITNYIIYICLGYCYFHFVNLGETARRIRLLRELNDAPGGLTKEEMLNRYNAGMIVKVRLNRLLSKGQIVLRNDRYYIGNSLMLFISRILVVMKIIVLGKRSEFD